MSSQQKALRQKALEQGNQVSLSNLLCAVLGIPFRIFKWPVSLLARICADAEYDGIETKSCIGERVSDDR